jgi:hypothetical protein
MVAVSELNPPKPFNGVFYYELRTHQRHGYGKNSRHKPGWLAVGFDTERLGYVPMGHADGIAACDLDWIYSIERIGSHTVAVPVENLAEFKQFRAARVYE